METRPSDCASLQALAFPVLDLLRFRNMESSHHLHSNHIRVCCLRARPHRPITPDNTCSDLGFNRTAANALATVGGVLALIVVFFFAWLSDRTNRRGFCVMAAQICYLITIIIARQTQPHVGPWSRWGLWTAVNAFAVGYHPIHNTCMSISLLDYLHLTNIHTYRGTIELYRPSRALSFHRHVGHVRDIGTNGRRAVVPRR